MIKCRPQDCTGCGACEYSCLQNAITMRTSREGFLYPLINEALCINCNLCNYVCPVLTKKIEREANQCYAVQLKDKQLLKMCASGGSFFGIASTVIRKNGAVFGVKDCTGVLNYVKAESVLELRALLGSKYYQCNINSLNYREIVASTKEKLTLVSGTPCMISAIKNLNGINPDNLMTFEILCQGVHNKSVVNKFYREKEAQKGVKIRSHSFRSKDSYVGRNYLNRYEYDDNTIEYLIGEEDPLSLSFQRQIFLRESCYRCRYANEERVADFTAGDLWEFSSSELQKDLGCSALICNSKKAEELLNESKKMFYTEKIEKDVALNDNIPFHHPVKRPLCRNWSYKLLNILSPTATTKICCYKYYIKRMILRRKQ